MLNKSFLCIPQQKWVNKNTVTITSTKQFMALGDDLLIY